MQIMMKVLSEKRFKIMEIVMEEVSPSVISSKLGISRQGVEKHLNVLTSYLLVNKIRKNGRVYYRVSKYGEFLLNGLQQLNSNLIKNLRDDYYMERANLESMLKKGSIPYSEYRERIEDLETRYSKYFGVI